MTLYTKSILKNTAPEDGVRISVMSRHTLNDGKTPDTRITADNYSKWMKELAPPAKLVGQWYKNNIEWAEFEKQYLQHLAKPNIATLVQQLANDALTADITILCIEDTAEYCHRRVLAEECLKYAPQLKIVHL